MRNRTTLVVLGVVCSLVSYVPASSGTRTLSLEARIDAQRAIEDVYWKHRIWPKDNPTVKPPLSEVMPDAVIRARVEDYLKKSNALEAVWQHPVTGDQLQAELDRIVRDTRSVATLNDLFRALGDDPLVIAETLARQTLVDRLARDWYANDSRFHGATKRQAEAARTACRTVSEMRAMGGEYRELSFVQRRDNSTLPAPRKIQLDAAEWDAHRASLKPAGQIGELEETPEAFTVTAVLARGPDETQLATVTFPKTPFETWWSQRRSTLSATVDSDSGPYEIKSPSAACVDGTWRVTSAGVPPPRGQHTAVWTGSEMIVWGGYDGVSAAYGSGARYIPAIDSWGFMSTSVATIEARIDHTAVWTGTEMIVWGGVPAGTSVALRTGGRYNPVTDQWALTAVTAATPAARQQHTAVWTGSVMVVWGGILGGGGAVSSGGMYAPSSDSWTATSLVGAPSARSSHTAVWTGAQMIVWGGASSVFSYLNDGARFNPASNTWTPMSAIAAPAARGDHTAVWDGNEMIVWGGEWQNGFELTTNTGGRYVPATDTWTATSTTAGVPTARNGHTAVWTGTRMLVWGGQPFTGQPGLNTGSSYDPQTQVWTALPALNAPPARYSATAVWTGTEMVVWGGKFNGPGLNTGGRYNPASGTWLPTSTTTAPAARSRHSSVWTGSEMIIWGGTAASNVGGRYAPATDTWTPIPVGPVVGEFASAVWTGSEMLIWGGYIAPPAVVGHRYNPTSNVWSPISDVNAPVRRTEQSAVWTGSLMIVWGGNSWASLDNPLNTGGKYNPATDTWVATSTTGAPTARAAHSAVWTGSSMIVWSGGNFNTNVFSSAGGRYNPLNDTWTPTSVAPGVPTGRYFHSSVWTGDRMIVWGGSIDFNGSIKVATGGVYDPAADTWSATSTGSNVPTARENASEVWTGREMIIWGGYANGTQATGGRYNPVNNAWAPMSFDPHEPSSRLYHTAEYTGTEMIIWGGSPDTNTGGLFCADACATPVTYYRDVDGDGYGTAGMTTLACTQPAGYSSNSTDCNDANPGINPGATEQCDGLDRNCDTFTDTVAPGPVTIIGSSRISNIFSWHYWTPIPGARYDMVRGTIGTLPVGLSPGNEVCMADNIPDTFRDDADAPAAGQGFWSIVRAMNSCGNGTWGFRTLHGVPTTERVTPTCP